MEGLGASLFYGGPLRSCLVIYFISCEDTDLKVDVSLQGLGFRVQGISLWREKS